MRVQLGIIVSEYNTDITLKMCRIALKHANTLGAKVLRVIYVPGAFEIPFALKKLIKDKDIDGIVTLGAIIKGDTNHDEVIAHCIARKILDISIEFEKPVSLGISGPGMSREDAKNRIEEYAKHAVNSAIKMIQLFKQRPKGSIKH